MMKNFSRGFLTALVVSAAFAVLPGSSDANHQWSTYRWKITGAPFTLSLGNSLSNTWQDPLMNATWGGKDYYGENKSGWDSSAVLNLTIESGRALSNLRKCPPTNGRVEVCNYTYGTNGWLGVAQIWITGGFIYQGTVKLNDSYFNNSRYKYGTPAWRNMVMCQEVGHTFGLSHQDETFNNKNFGSCMDYTNYPEGGTHGSTDYGPSNEYPGGTKAGDSDFEELYNIYNGKNDGGTTVVSPSAPSGPGRGKMPPALTDTDSDEPVQLGTAQWGKLMRSTNRGRTELFELDLGGGHKVVTHVIWADPEDQPAPVRGRR